jgi:signal transduction histidine kinase
MILAVCALFDGTHAYIAYVLGGDEGYLPDLPVRISLLLSTVFFWVTYLPLVPCILFLTKKYRLDVQRPARKLVIHTGGAIAFAYLHISFNAFLNVQVNDVGVPFGVTLKRMVSLNFPVDFLAYWAIIGVAYALHFYSRSQQQDLMAAQLQASLAEARLHSLRTQLRPHFLFNTLNAISTLALKGEGRAVARSLSRLTDLLRIGFNENYPQLIPLSKELELIDNYLQIQRLLLGDRLAIETNIDPSVTGAEVPCLILQPIVENAIIHGLSKDSGAGRLRIEACRDHKTLRLTVTDSGPGFAYPPMDRGSIGLANTEARLQHHYGRAHVIEYGRSIEGGARVTISIPFGNDAAGAEIGREVTAP